MVKLLEVIGRRSDWTHADFVKYQITTHLDVVDRVPEFRNRVRRYMQNHLFIHPDELASFNGLCVSANTDSIIEVWYDDVEEIRRAFQEPRYLEVIRPDELTFGDVDGVWGVSAEEILVTERSGFHGEIKMFLFLKRTHHLSHSEFLDRWRYGRDQRMMGAKAFGDGVGRFVENLIGQDPAQSLPGMRAFDLVVELWFDSLIHVAEFANDPDVLKAMTGSEAEYIDGEQTVIYVGQEQPASAEWLRRGQTRGY